MEGNEGGKDMKSAMMMLSLCTDGLFDLAAYLSLLLRAGTVEDTFL